jgi:hypothetical protein
MEDKIWWVAEGLGIFLLQKGYIDRRGCFLMSEAYSEQSPHHKKNESLNAGIEGERLKNSPSVGFDSGRIAEMSLGEQPEEKTEFSILRRCRVIAFTPLAAESVVVCLF